MDDSALARKKAAARLLALDLLTDSFDNDDVDVSPDAPVDFPEGGDDGAWVTVRLWVRSSDFENLEESGDEIS
jgi:hypothetical protein